MENVYHSYVLETNLGSSMDEGKWQEAGRLGECCSKKNDNVNGENYISLLYCNVLESIGIDGYLNVMAKEKGIVGKHPGFWSGELDTELGALHWDKEHRNKKQVLFRVIVTVDR